MDILSVVAPGELQFFAARRAGADKDGIETAVVQQLAHAVDAMIQLELDTHVEDVVDLLVEHGGRQTELRDVGPHESAGLLQRFEDGDLVAERRQVVRNRERGASGTDQRNLFAIGLLGRFWQTRRYVIPMVGGDALQPANGDGLVFDPSAPAGRLAGTIADTTENAGKYVGTAVKHVGVGKTPLGNEADIAWNIRVRRTGPLTVDDLMKIVRIGLVCWLHAYRAQPTPTLRPAAPTSR